MHELIIVNSYLNTHDSFMNAYLYPDKNLVDFVVFLFQNDYNC